jgi:hypothetical protein
MKPLPLSELAVQQVLIDLAQHDRDARAFSINSSKVDIMSNKINFNDYAIKLSKGNHESPNEGMCIMECVAYIAGEAHTDHPKCASPVCTSYAIRVNDKSTSKQRDTLTKFVLRLAGSKNDELEVERFLILLNAATHKFLPFVYRQHGHAAFAVAAESIPAVKDPSTFTFALSKLNELLQALAKSDNYSCKSVSNASKEATTLLFRVMMMLQAQDGKLEFVRGVVKPLAVQSLFTVLTAYNHLFMHNDEFELHCEVLDEMLKLTDEKQYEAVPEKLSELQNITKDHGVQVAI